MNKSKLYGAIFGVLVGDALGVPAGVYSREQLKAHPVWEMRGLDRHPPGSWSDDGSLTLCLVDTLCTGYDPAAIGESFCNWLYRAEWTPYGRVFDSGAATRAALRRISEGIPALEAGGRGERNNGNGSLMRIMPILFYLHNRPQSERLRIVKEVSSITHGHLRSVIACQFYIEMGRCILQDLSLKEAYNNATGDIVDYYKESAGKSELSHFKRVLFGDISKLKESEIFSDGYVVHTLEASLWSLLTTGSFEEAVIKAVNLGNDSDTTGAVTGGLAGLYYGMQNIPPGWIKSLARLDELIALLGRFWKSCEGSGI